MVQGEEPSVHTQAGTDEDHSLKRKDHPTTEQQLDRVPKRLKNYFQLKKEEKEFIEETVKEVEFSSYLSKGTEIIKTWHVRKARDLLLELVQVKVGGELPSHIKTILDETVNRREEIESLSLYLAESMVIKCTVHSVDFIHNMLEHNRLICPENDISQAVLMFDGDSSEDQKKQLMREWEKFTLPNLVKIQQELNLVDEEIETNFDENEKLKVENIMEYEDITHDNDFAFHLDSSHKPLEFGCREDERIERLNSLDESEIKKVSEKSLWNNNAPSGEPVYIHYDKESKEYIFTEQELEEYDGFIDDTALYCKYLFEEMLFDESEMPYTESPFSELKFSLEPKYHNPFLYILETTMKMFVKTQNPEEHQTFEVSYLRLATSLYILNCINTELVYLKNRVTLGTYQLMARATVRGVIDSFVDNRNFSCFVLNPDTYTYEVVKPEKNDILKDLEEDLRYFLNGDDPESDTESVSSESSESSSDSMEMQNITPVNPEENYKPAEETSPSNFENGKDINDGEGLPDETSASDYISDTDTDTDSEVEYDSYLVGHPIWDNPINITQSEVEETNLHKRSKVDPVSKSLVSTFEYLKSDYCTDIDGSEERVQEPIVNEELVTLYYCNEGNFLNEDLNVYPDCLILCADHMLDDNLDVESQLLTTNSIYRDLTRLMKRGSVVYADPGAYFESFLTLKEYIQGVIEYLSLIKTDKNVTIEDVLDALKRVHNHTLFTGGHGPYDFETQYNYSDFRFDFVTNPTYPPEDLIEIDFEKLWMINKIAIDEKYMFIDERFENNDPLLDHDHLSHQICYFLGDMTEIQGSNIFCDNFIEFEDGRKLGLYGPLVKAKCPSFYDRFLSGLPKHQGVDVKFIKEILPKVNFNSLHEFFEYVYRGVLIDGNESISSYVLTIQEEFSIVQGAPFRDMIVMNNDIINSCCTFHNLWKDDLTKDFTLILNRDGTEKSDYKLHKFILASRLEFFRNLIIENPDAKEYEVSEFVTDSLVLERFVFYLYHNSLNYPKYFRDEEEVSKEENGKTEEVVNGNIEVEEIELNLDQNIELLKLAHKFGDNDLVKILSRTISHEINHSNVSNFLNLSICYQSYDLFKACEFILLTSDQNLIEQVTEFEDEREYFNTLSGAIDETNIIEKLSYVMKILNSPSCDLEFYFIYRLDDFHKRNLIWYIIRNISNIDPKIIESLQYIPIDEKTNCAQVVNFLAKKYYASLDSFLIPTKGE